MLTLLPSATTKAVADPGFPRGGGANSRGAPTFDFAKFSQKVHEIERIWTPGGACPLCPPISATGKVMFSQASVKNSVHGGGG